MRRPRRPQAWHSLAARLQVNNAAQDNHLHAIGGREISGLSQALGLAWSGMLGPCSFTSRADGGFIPQPAEAHNVHLSADLAVSGPPQELPNRAPCASRLVAPIFPRLWLFPARQDCQHGPVPAGAGTLQVRFSCFFLEQIARTAASSEKNAGRGSRLRWRT